MSFFGFDTSLPRDQSGASKGAPGRGSSDPFDPTFGNDGGYDEDAAFEEKLRGLRAAGQEDVEIYTWGGGEGEEDGHDGLGDLLKEAGDDFNDDTFGFGGNVGRDFDFSGTGGAGTAAGKGKGGGLPSFFDSSRASDSSALGKVRKNDAAFASTMDDFWQMPDTKPVAQPAFPVQQQSTLEDRQVAPQAAHAAPASVAERRPLTMEEVEAEMRARRAQPAAPATQAPQPASGPAPLGLAESAFPPLGTASVEAPAGQPQQAQSSQNVVLPFMQSLPPVPNANSPDAPAIMFARMRAMLETLPNPIQSRILALPPFMHFGATESVVRDFPALTVAANPEKLPQQVENPRLWPRIDGTVEEQNTIRFMVDTAMTKIDEAHRMENRRQLRLAKIRAMSLRNNLMSRSDKDFITRIQVSQLITNDPYTDDFYAHIYFALHGNQNRVALASAEGAKQPAEQAKVSNGDAVADEKADEQPQQGQRKGNNKKKQQQANRRETAMLKMQQQVERIVQNRKERIDKAAGSAALEGALGRISLSTTKAPRKMLQINQEGTDAADAAAQQDAQKDDKVGVGHAQDAVQQALQGASLAQGAGGVLRRPALTTFEVLSILERLYDIVLTLEQSRRTAPADSSEQNVEPAAVEWRAKRDELTQALWTELRVLEPLEVSDPHPFVSLLSTIKGKKLLPRALRHLSSEQTLTAMTMIVASFDRLDVVKNSVLLDETDVVGGARAEKRADVQRQTDAFATSIVPSMLTLMATVPMRIVSGMLALFIERNDPVRVAQSKPGVAFLTIFLSRAASLRQSALTTPVGGDQESLVGPADLAQWGEIFNLLVQRLSQPPALLTTLFPSTRAKARLPFGVHSLDAQRKAELEVEDRDVWQLMAAVAVSADMAQQQVLVSGLREKILENVLEAKQWSQANPTAASSGEADLRIRNVNLLLHALNLDAAQITV